MRLDFTYANAEHQARCDMRRVLNEQFSHYSALGFWGTLHHQYVCIVYSISKLCAL